MINAVPLLAAAGGEYEISHSVRLRSSASAYFNRTPASASDQKKWTFSAWVKRGQLGATQIIAQAGTSGTTFTYIAYFNSSDQLVVLDSTVSGVSSARTTSAVFRDPSAWYHIVVYLDAANSTSKVYVNNVEQTCTGTQPSNQNWAVNSAIEHRIGRAWATNTNYLDGYLTEINFIDGQALTPSSFGETDSITGVWKPKKYSGTYGTNGFYLNFSDNSSNTATTIGKDYSGNGNNWTPNNISVTSGVTYDSMLDTPTPYADGGNGRGNYCVLNPISKALSNGGSGTTSNGNLTIAYGATNWYGHKGSIAVSSGKWYYEVVNTTGTIYVQAGFTLTTVASETATGVYRYRSNGEKVSTAYAAYGASWSSAGDIVGVALDLDAGTLVFYKNGVSQGNAFSSIPAGEYAPEVIVEAGTTANANFGQRPFAYTPPSGYVALNTQNLPAPTISAGNKYMDVAIQTGNTTGRTVSGLAFQPDLVWVKNRAGSTNRRWGLIDSVRGVNKTLTTQYTDAEVTSQTDLLTAFNSDGFTIGADAGLYGWNGFAESYAHFVWKAGNGSSSNTSGSITSTVSVNATAGFSVVTYTGNGTAGATIGHGLGVAPSMMIAKNRSSGGSASYEWTVYHASLGATKAVFLNDTGAAATDAGYWYNTAPTSTLITVPSNSRTNVNGSNFVIYCFSAVAGYSSAFSFTGNGSADGVFVYLGFRPRMVLLKRTDTTGNWYIWDTSRNTYNVVGEELYPNLSNAGSTATDLDILSNGFKMRNTTADFNASGGSYIGFAWAENPFKLSLAR